MNIEKINIFEKIEPRLRKFAEMRVGHKPISELHDAEIKKECAIIINLAHADTGQYKSNITQKILDYQRDVLVNELKGKYKQLTIPEVAEAFRLGIRNEFGDYFGLCAATYYKFIKSFYELKERSESMKAYLNIATASLHEKKLTEEEKEAIIKNGTEDVIKNFKETNELPYYCVPYYDYLEKKNLLILSKEEKKEIYKEAKILYSKEINLKKQKRDITISEAKDLLENLDKNQSVVSLCKKNSIKKIFGKNK